MAFCNRLKVLVKTRVPKKNTAWKLHWLFAPLRICQTIKAFYHPSANQHTYWALMSSRERQLWDMLPTIFTLLRKEKKKCFQMITDRQGNGWFPKVLMSVKCAILGSTAWYDVSLNRLMIHALISAPSLVLAHIVSFSRPFLELKLYLFPCSFFLSYLLIQVAAVEINVFFFFFF